MWKGYLVKTLTAKVPRYYEFYTSQTWGAKENYDVLINTTGKDIKKLARIVAANFEDETSL